MKSQIDQESKLSSEGEYASTNLFKNELSCYIKGITNAGIENSNGIIFTKRTTEYVPS